MYALRLRAGSNHSALQRWILHVHFGVDGCGTSLCVKSGLQDCCPTARCKRLHSQACVFLTLHVLRPLRSRPHQGRVHIQGEILLRSFGAFNLVTPSAFNNADSVAKMNVGDCLTVMVSVAPCGCGIHASVQRPAAHTRAKILSKRLAQ